jgi:hypothetical protein
MISEDALGVLTSTLKLDNMTVIQSSAIYEPVAHGVKGYDQVAWENRLPGAPIAGSLEP